MPPLTTLLLFAALAYVVLLIHLYGVVPLVQKIVRWEQAEVPRLEATGHAVVADLQALFSHAGVIAKQNPQSIVSLTAHGATATITPAAPAAPAPPVATPVVEPSDASRSALPPLYLMAEAAKRPELDAPDWSALAQVLAMPVQAAATLVNQTTGAVRAALPRAARILNPNLYVKIAMFDWATIQDAITGTDPIMRRFAAMQYLIGTVGDRAGLVAAPSYPFPSPLGPDGDVVYVPYDVGAPGNVTLDSLSHVATAP